MPLIGAVVIMLTFVDKNSGEKKTTPAKFKILAAHKTDWVPIILRGTSIDCEERQGLGLIPCPNSLFLSILQIYVERVEKYTQGRPGRSVYACRSELDWSGFYSDESDEEEDLEVVDES